MALRRRPLPFLAGKYLPILLALSIFPNSSIGLAADSTAVAISAVITSQSNCRFRTNGPAPALAFGTIDPSSPSDVDATASLEFRCMGSAPQATFLITDDDGMNETGPDGNRMRHATLATAFLPYAFSLSPVSGTVSKGVWTPLTISGTVRSADFGVAASGSYSDAVTITIQP